MSEWIFFDTRKSAVVLFWLKSFHSNVSQSFKALAQCLSTTSSSEMKSNFLVLLQEWLADSGEKKQLDGLVVSSKSKHKHDKHAKHANPS